MLTDLHMHSNYSDGKQSPEEMIETAIQLGFSAIAVTDHVWKTSDWVPAYSRHLAELKHKYRNDIAVFTGIEAKVLNFDGDIDADPSFDPLVDLILGSVHRLPKPDGHYRRSDINQFPLDTIWRHWFAAFSGLISNPRVDIIAHPFAELKSYGIPENPELIRQLTGMLAASGKIIELNVRYGTPSAEVVQSLAEAGAPMTVSSDSHSAADLVKYSRLIKEQSGKNLSLVDIRHYVQAKKAGNSGRSSDSC